MREKGRWCQGVLGTERQKYSDSGTICPAHRLSETSFFPLLSFPLSSLNSSVCIHLLERWMPLGLGPGPLTRRRMGLRRGLPCPRGTHLPP